MRFSKGDTVRVKPNLKVGNIYRCGFVSSMKIFKGKIMRIKKVYYEDRYYKLEKGEGWNFSEEMLMPAKNNVKKISSRKV